jgi:hypothetical protein
MLLVGGLFSTSYASASNVPSSPTPTCFVGQCISWHAADTWSHESPIYLTSFHAGGGASAPVVYAAWMNVREVDLGLYLGVEGPGTTALNRGPERVPNTGLARLLATFNSGFYEADAHEGFYTHNTLYFPMVKGQATLVRYTSGAVNIVNWLGGAMPDPSIEMARQNLTLLVQGGHATAATAVNARWGLTLHGVPDVWRSAVGIDANGNLLYVAAPNQTAASLAAILVSLHAVTAMELDINPEWPILATYGGPGGVGARLAVANPNQVPTRFLTTTTKDFFAVYLSTTPGGAEPW